MQETNFLQWLVLALIQGLTEYLPISSSAHLILISKVMHWKDQGLIMDIAAHAGSLIAVIWYFKNEVVKLFQGKNWPLFYQLTLASIPLAVVGYTFADSIEKFLRSPVIIALASIIFGILLFASDINQKKTNQTNNANKKDIKKNIIKYKQALLIGFAQIFALIPGASRSGVTMTAAMAQGFSRTQAAKFSFLLAIPALLMTTAYGFLKLYKQPTEYNILGVVTVLIISFLASLVSIKLFLKLIEKISMAVFLWYRVGLALLILGYSL
ncbi:MAG: undecaprenyl-diphosphate phosphatase [Alcanivoracaceae bacterium]|nr:undecaprenyl-diphosphate phosphatase [Alcanivoracaceae bacterium]